MHLGGIMGSGQAAAANMGGPFGGNLAGQQALAQQARNYHTTINSYMLVSEQGPVTIYENHVRNPKLAFLRKTEEGIPDSVIADAFLLGEAMDQLAWLSHLQYTQRIDHCWCYVLASEDHVLMARMAGCYVDKDEVLERIKFRG